MPEVLTIYDDFDFSDDNADIFSKYWGFESRHELKAFGKELEKDRLLEISLNNGTSNNVI